MIEDVISLKMEFKVRIYISPLTIAPNTRPNFSKLIKGPGSA